MGRMDFSSARSIGALIRDKNIVLRGADAATAMGFTQLPNFLLKSKNLSSGDKVTFAMLLSYAWQNDFCFPGQARLSASERTRIDRAFTEMSENPFSGDIRFLKGLGGTLRKRVGDWRILFELNLENRLIFVTA